MKGDSDKMKSKARLTFCAAAALCFQAAFGGAAIPLPEHPRPDWERPQWINLNGEWDFGFEPGVYDRKIVVPFGWGTALSGVKDEKGKNTGYYRRAVRVPQEWKGKRVFLVVGAADYETEFSFDGKNLGSHVGGYTPFEFELTEFVKWGEEQTAEFKIRDPDFLSARVGSCLIGKQGYGNVRGIWQTVYLEARGNDYIDSARFTPSIATSSVRAELRLAAPASAALVAEVQLDGKTTKVPFAKGETAKAVDIAFAAPRLWDLDHPNLYDVALALGDDEVKTYFGFREIGAGKNANGDPYVTLNGKPIYLQLCLDQTYHPQGYYTFPTDEFMKNEIMISKKLALTGNRVHVKVEVPRKLYWADKLGLLIQADVPNAWGAASDEMFAEHWACFEGMVKRDFNHPSIYQWTLFNETWGLLSKPYISRKGRYEKATQERVAETYRRAKALDPTRLIDDNSATKRDHVATDVNTWHVYLPAYKWMAAMDDICAKTYPGSKWNYASGRVQDGTPMMGAETGTYASGGHCDHDITWDYHGMINALRSHLKCAGFCFTEHHDVVAEWTGYVHEDRSPKEFGIEDLAYGMTFADFHAKAAITLLGTRGSEIGETVASGATVRIPVGVSLVTDEYAGKTLTLTRRAWWLDGAGRKREAAAVQVGGSFVAKNWQCEKLWDVDFAAPEGPACGCVVFDLMADGKRIARNFWSFSTVASDAAMMKPKASQWSQGTVEVLGGLKLNGFGKGWFEYEVAVSPEGGTFRAELSAKRRNLKDVKKAKVRQIDYVTGKRVADSTKNPSAYPQTGGEKHPANLTVRVDGKVALERILPDDPADHRGVLSWLAQPRDGYLHDAGSYGWLVEVKIPPEAVKDGKAIVRLESDAGLAVYGPRFGRYPLGPSVGGAFDLQREEFAKYYRQITGREPPEGAVRFAIDPAVSKSGRDAYRIVSTASVQQQGEGAASGRAACPQAAAVAITGSNLRSVWYGLYDLLERRGGCRWFWDGDVVPKRGEIDLSNLDVHEEARFEYRGLRYFAHRGLTRFQAEHWGPEDWKKEIDWILKRRLNVFMLRIGQDDLFQRTFPDACAYPDPAKPLPGAGAGYNDRSLFWSLQFRGRLRDDLQKYGFDRGLMVPEDYGTMTHWYAPTPLDYIENRKPPFYPGADTRPVNNRVWDVRDERWIDEYWKMTKTAVETYGKGAPKPQLLHTIGTGERILSKDKKENFKLKVLGLQRFMSRVERDYPDAKLLMPGWDFYFSWTPQEVKDFLKMLDPKKCIVWDYSADFKGGRKSNFMNWDVIGKFPYTYSIFLAYEKALDARAQYPLIEERQRLVQNDPFCKGFIFWPESSHTDTLLLRYFTANAWSDRAIPHGEVLDEFCASRYGANAEAMKAAWKAVLPASWLRGWTTTYGDGMLGGDFGGEKAVPALPKWRKNVADAEKVFAMLAEIEWKDDFIKRDTIDIARMALDRAISRRRADLSADVGKWRKGGTASVQQQEGAVESAELVERANEIAEMCDLMADLLALHTDYSLWESYLRLDAVQKIQNPDFSKTLFENASCNYCRSHQYELARYWYAPHFRKVAENLAKAIAAGDRKAKLSPNAEQERLALKERPLESLKPTLPRTEENFKATLRKIMCVLVP